MRTRLTEKEKRARRRREALLDLLIFALIALAACAPDLDGIRERDESKAEDTKSEAILEVPEEVEEISTEGEKPPQIENNEVEEVEEVSEVEEGGDEVDEVSEVETTESSELAIYETEEVAKTDEDYYEETYYEEGGDEVDEEYPKEVEIVTEEYTYTATVDEEVDVDEDYHENVAAALLQEVQAFEEGGNIEEYSENVEEKAEEVQEEAQLSSENGLIYLGVYEITAYEWTGNPCANGNYPTEGYTVACNSLPFGTVVYIEGIGYRTVEDRGADWHSPTWIDLYLGDVDSCYNFGRQYLNVYIVE